MSHKKSYKRLKKRKNAVFFFKFCRHIRKRVIDLPQKNETMEDIHSRNLHGTAILCAKPWMRRYGYGRGGFKRKCRNQSRTHHLAELVGRSWGVIPYRKNISWKGWTCAKGCHKHGAVLQTLAAWMLQRDVYLDRGLVQIQKRYGPDRRSRLLPTFMEGHRTRYRIQSQGNRHHKALRFRLQRIEN